MQANPATYQEYSMAKFNKLPVDVQIAAACALIYKHGYSLEEIKQQHPQLKKGLKAMRANSTPQPA